MYGSIILSGLPRSGKSTLISALVEIFSWPKYGVGDLFRERWAALPEEGKPPFPEWWKSRPRGEQLQVNKDLLELVRREKVIADTRFAKYLDGNGGLTLFLTAPLNVRAQRAYDLGDYPGKSIDEISKLLDGREKTEFNIGMDLFGFDYRDPNHYDLVINSSRLSVEQEIEQVKALMQRV